MITLDTNVLVRLLTEDDPDQTEKARGILRQCIENQVQCLIVVPVLCELLWVLRRGYKVPRSELIDVVKNLLEDPLYEVEHRNSVEKALSRFERGKGDFADYLIETRGRSHRSTPVYSFDRGLNGEDGFTVL